MTEGITELVQQNARAFIGALVPTRAGVASAVNFIRAANTVPLVIAHVPMGNAVRTRALDVVWRTLKVLTVGQVGHISTANLIAQLVELVQTDEGTIDDVS